MPDTVFYQGNPVMVDYTAGADIALGEVVVTGDTPRIAHRAIANGALGALAVHGGIYRVTGDAAIAADKKVYWNNSAKKVTETASGNKMIGVTVSACSGDGSTCYIFHNPGA